MKTDSRDAPNGSQWTEWKGGECPVAGNVRVEVKYLASGEPGFLASDYREQGLPASEYYWASHNMSPGTIVAYRVVGPLLETGAPSAAPAATPNEAVPKSELERLMSEKMEWAAERDRKDATIADLRGKLEQAQKDAESKQAKIDALMLEFCPDEMPAEQTANWAAHQVPASPEENAAIDAALKEASNG